MVFNCFSFHKTDKARDPKKNPKRKPNRKPNYTPLTKILISNIKFLLFPCKVRANT